MHDVRVAQGVHGEHFQIPASSVLAIDLLQAGFANVVLEDLADAVGAIGGIPTSSGVKEVSASVIFTSIEIRSQRGTARPGKLWLSVRFQKRS